MAANNAGSGFAVLGVGRLNLEFSDARENANSGLLVAASAIAFISNNAFTHNGFGVNSLGTTFSRLNNTIIDNGSGSSDNEVGNPISSFNGN